MEIKEKLNNSEGNEAGTSTAMEPDKGIGLNNASKPTADEELNAGVQNETSDLGTTPESNPEQANDPNPEQGQAQASSDPENALPPGDEQGGGNETGIDDETGTAETSATKPMFTQSQVDEIAGKARKEGREKAIKDFFQRYGVNSADELDNLFGDAQRFETIKGEYETEKKAWNEADQARTSQLNELKESVALLSSGIDKNRYEDAKFILRGKGLEVTEENIAAELATHPEWKAEAAKEPAYISEAGGQQMPFKKMEQPQQVPEAPKPATAISVLGNEAAPAKGPELSDYQKAMNLFKV